MGTKKVKFTKSGIEKLPNDKPVLYRIETESGTLNYAGTAQRGRVRKRVTEEIDEIPGTSVRIEQFSSIEEALKKEARVIERNQTKYNEQDK